MKRIPFLISLLILALTARATVFLAPNNPPATISLSWDPSPSPLVVTYKLYSGTAGPRQYTAALTVGSVLNFTVTNLIRGATNYFAVTAIDGGGLESVFSNEIAFAPPAPPLPPAALLPPIELSIQTRPNASAGLWADAGMFWTLTPAQARQFFRLQISPGQVIAAAARPATPPKAK
jgi:hypothetical protein